MTEAMSEAASFELLSLECRIDTKGTEHYYNKQGQIHRVYGPAVKYADGTHAWFQNGQLHRWYGPAIEYADGGRTWYQNGVLHRIDGPAAVFPDGYRAWYQNGLRHRLDGPAVENEYGSCNWFIDDNLLTEAEWRQAIASMGVYSPR